MKITLPLAVSPFEIAEAFNDLRTKHLYELPAQVKREGRWQSAILYVEAEDRETALRTLRWPRGCEVRLDRRKLRKSEE